MNARINSDGMLKRLEAQRYDQDVGERKAEVLFGGKCSWVGRFDIFNKS